MTYHLSRVMHWLQNNSAAPYPTNIDRQVTQPPLAEYYIMHLYALSGTDRAANFVQWIFMTGCLTAVWRIVKEMNFSNRTALLAVFFTATIPMGILQSSSTQNDYVCAFFIVCSILFLIRCRQQNFKLSSCVFFSLCLALACIAKGSAYIFMLPVVLVFGVFCIWYRKLYSLRIFALTAIIFIFFNGIFFYRNFNLYDSPLGNDYELQNTVLSFNGMLGNTLKNVAMHFNSPAPVFNHAVNEFVFRMHKMLSIDVNSSKYNWAYSPPFQIGMPSLQEDSAGSLLHVAACIVLCFFAFQKKYRHTHIRLILFLLISMLLLFSFILKWQVWHVRLQLPLLVLASIFIACIIVNSKKFILIPFCILFFSYALPFLFFNSSRPLLGSESVFITSRNEQYFQNNKTLQKPFEAMTAFLSSDEVSKVGFEISGDAWEYPLRALTDQFDIRFEHINVPNPTAKCSDKNYFSDFVPQVIITNTENNRNAENIMYQNRRYLLRYSNDNWRYFEAQQKDDQRITILNISGECISPNPEICNL